MRRDLKEERLAGVPMFSACSRKQLGVVARNVDVVTVAKGEPVVRENDPGHAMYIVAEGQANVRRGGRVVATAGPGDYFGELSLLDGERRDATVTAESDMTLLEVGQPQLIVLLEELPDLARRLLTGMARRLHELDRRG